MGKPSSNGQARRQPEQTSPPSTQPVVTAGKASFGWPQAFVLIVLVPISFAFAFLLLKIGLGASAAVMIPLILLAGVAVIVLPVAGCAMLRRLGAAAAAFFTGGRS